MGVFDVPQVERSPWGIVCLILNIIPYAGIGTIIAYTQTKDTGHLIAGIIQLLTGWLLIGWIWSIIWGVLMFVKSN